MFTSPTLVADKTDKQERGFYIPRLHWERSLTGTEFEVQFRNELTQIYAKIYGNRTNIQVKSTDIQTNGNKETTDDLGNA